MLEDRPYMRRSSFAPRWSLTVLLVIASVLAYIGQVVLFQSWSERKLFGYFALSPEGLAHGYIWQLLTFQFMHGGILHLLFNCLAIYMFGREVEETLGPSRFLTLYFCSGIFGGILQVGLGQFLANVFQNYRMMGPVLGASAGAFGLIAAFAVLYPEKPLTMLIYFVIPVTMRAKFLLLFEGLFALGGLGWAISRDPRGTQVAHAAHLGGMLTGIIFVRYAVHWQWPQFHRTQRRPVQRLVKVPSQKGALWGRKETVTEDLPPEEFLSKEVDPILDKISAHGIQSLTERERRILQAAREKMGKR